jgi:transcriptional regulator with XRE-family HTH domain
MTADELRAWQARCGFRRDAEAAAALGVAISTYRRMRNGRSAIKPPTRLLAAYYEVFSKHWLSIAEAAYTLAHIAKVPLAPIAGEKVADLVTKVLNGNTKRR